MGQGCVVASSLYLQRCRMAMSVPTVRRELRPHRSLERSVTAVRDDDHDHSLDHAEHRHGGRLAALWHTANHIITAHSHDAAGKVDQAMETSHDGIRVLWV